jgi:DNA (cytosine-5)-methyltransferase 1|nr:MAG TPA: Cytosine specific methyltransferase [Caudoviricetes sp.]
MQFVDFFAGIGGIRLGLEQAGHKCVGFCEFDKYARTAYKAMYDTEGEWENHDVRTVKPYDVPAADLWCFGFPCQDISVAGKQKGLQEGERSGLFYEVMRLLAGRRKEDRPRWLLVENVKNLLSIGNGFDFARLLLEVGGHGYSLQWDTLNSKDYGVPQNRERVFIIGYLGNIRGREVFPIRPADGENPCELNEITQGVADAQRIYDGGGLARTLKGESGGQGGKTGLYAVKVLKPYGSTGGVCGFKIAENKTGIASTCAAHDYKGISRHNGNAVACAVLTPDREEKRQNGRRIKEPGEPSFTLTAQDRHGVALLDENIRIRRLTPRECWRLQGFPDEYFDKAKAAGISDTQLYKQAGNGVTVNVARAIGERLKEVEEHD